MTTLFRADLAFVSSTGESGTTNLEVTLSRPLPALEDYDVMTLRGASFEDIAIYGSSRSSSAKILKDLGFDFEFYGVTYNQVIIRNNGYIAFTSDQSSRSDSEGVDFSDGATLDGLPVIAPLWGNYYYGSVRTLTRDAGTPDARFIVQWERDQGRQISYQYSSFRNSFEFQAVLYERDGRIEFRYQDVEDPNHRDGQSIATLSTVGLSDGSGRYEQVSFRGTGQRQHQDSIHIAPHSCYDRYQWRFFR